MSEVALVARLILAAVFSLAAVAKVFDREGSREAMTEFGLPAGLARPAAALAPLAELAVAAALVPATSAGLGAVGSLLVLVVFSGAVVVNLARGNTPDCHCFGQVHSSPIGSSTLVRNAVLGGLSVLVMAEPGRSAGASVQWFGDLRGAEQAGVAVALVVFGLVGILGWAVVNLLGQQGRLLPGCTSATRTAARRSSSRQASDKGRPMDRAFDDLIRSFGTSMPRRRALALQLRCSRFRPSRGAGSARPLG